MTEEVEDVVVDTAEAFRIAAETARKVFEAGPSDEAAPDPEPGSSPAIGAESDVPAEPTPGEEGAESQDKPTEEKPEGVEIDPDTAWNEYADDEARKKALAANKAYGIEMARKAKELQAKLDEAPVVPEPEPEPVVEATPEPAEVEYEDWVKAALDKPETEGQQSIARIAADYNQLVAEKFTPAQEALEAGATKVREAKEAVRDSEVALKFLQGRKDPALYQDDIDEAKELLNEARFSFTSAKDAEIDAKASLSEINQERLGILGILRKEAAAAHQAEVAFRRDSASAKKAESDKAAETSASEKEQAEKQAEVDQAWEEAKLSVIKTQGIKDEVAQQVLRDAADGAIIRAANSGKSISAEEFVKFIEDSSLKPFKATGDRDSAVKGAIEITKEPGPSKATSDKPNADAQPIDYNEWKLKARAMMTGGR